MQKHKKPVQSGRFFCGWDSASRNSKTLRDERDGGKQRQRKRHFHAERQQHRASHGRGRASHFFYDALKGCLMRQPFYRWDQRVVTTNNRGRLSKMGLSDGAQISAQKKTLARHGARVKEGNTWG